MVYNDVEVAAPAVLHFLDGLVVVDNELSRRVGHQPVKVFEPDGPNLDTAKPKVRHSARCTQHRADTAHGHSNTHPQSTDTAHRHSTQTQHGARSIEQTRHMDTAHPPTVHRHTTQTQHGTRSIEQRDADRAHGNVVTAVVKASEEKVGHIDVVVIVQARHRSPEELHVLPRGAVLALRSHTQRSECKRQCSIGMGEYQACMGEYQAGSARSIDRSIEHDLPTGTPPGLHRDCTGTAGWAVTRPLPMLPTVAAHSRACHIGQISGLGLGKIEVSRTLVFIYFSFGNGVLFGADIQAQNDGGCVAVVVVVVVQ